MNVLEMLASAQLFICYVYFCFCLLFTVNLICNYARKSISSPRPKLVSYVTVDLTFKDDIYHCQQTYGAKMSYKI